MATKNRGSDGRFRSLGGVERVFEPGGGEHPVRQGKKHPCPDCSFCQGCAETRCLVCRRGMDRLNGTPCKKLSLQEQVLLYEEVNARASERNSDGG